MSPRHAGQAAARRCRRARFGRVGGDARRSRSTCGSSPPPTATSTSVVEEGTFREDLYYRLNVVRPAPAAAARAPRGHPAPGRALPGQALRAGAARRDRGEARPEALALLAGYRWPGNVRELENEIERAVGLVGASGSASAICRRTSPGPRGRAWMPANPDSLRCDRASNGSNGASSARRWLAHATTRPRRPRRWGSRASVCRRSFGGTILPEAAATTTLMAPPTELADVAGSPARAAGFYLVRELLTDERGS